MKLIGSLFLFVFYSTSLFCQFSGGSGTEDDPYQITSKKDMETLDELIARTDSDYWISEGKYFKLMNDITEPVTESIGSDHSDHGINYRINSFRGVFDGQGYTITVDINVEYFGGLFSCISAYYSNSIPKIKNLNVRGKIVSTTYAGGIVGYNDGGEITNCHNYATIIASTPGGITGLSRGKPVNIMSRVLIRDCTNSGTLIGGTGGGICGILGGIDTQQADMLGEQIVNCANYGLLNCNGWGAGIQDIGIGGIVGICQPTSVISNCINMGVVIGSNTKNVGCIVGHGYNTVLINCHYDKQMCTHGTIGKNE